MAGRKIIRDEDTGEVNLVRSVTVEVRREKGGEFFLCSIKGRLRGRSKDIEVATQSLKNKTLRRQIIAIFMAQGSDLDELIHEQFPKHTLLPYPKKEERRAAFRSRHKSRGTPLI